MAAGLLLDTDVLIDYLRAAPEAVAWLEGQTGRLCVSVISVAELDAGVREGREREELDAFVQNFEILPVDAVVAQRGGLLRRDCRRNSYRKISRLSRLIIFRATTSHRH